MSDPRHAGPQHAGPQHTAAELHALLSVAEQAAGQAADLDTATKQALADHLDRIRLRLMAPPHATAAPVDAGAHHPAPTWRPIAGSDRFAGLILLPPTQQLETCQTCQGHRVAGTGTG